MESKSLFHKKQKVAKVTVPAITRQAVTLGTQVPEKTSAEDLLPKPNESAFHKEMVKIVRKIKQIKKKLAEKIKVQEKERLTVGQLEEKKKQLQESQLELHKQRKSIEATLKSLNKIITTVYSF